MAFSELKGTVVGASCAAQQEGEGRQKYEAHAPGLQMRGSGSKTSEAAQPCHHISKCAASAPSHFGCGLAGWFSPGLGGAKRDFGLVWDYFGGTSVNCEATTCHCPL